MPARKAHERHEYAFVADFLLSSANNTRVAATEMPLLDVRQPKAALFATHSNEF
jgi:hypothetical protein